MDEQTRKALELARKALQRGSVIKDTQAIAAIDAALAAPAAPVAQGEPVAWRDAVQKLVIGFNHVSGIARQWEPDHSSGADRAKWARATEACADVVKLLNAAPSPAPASQPSDADIDAATSAARDALMDHVSEYGTTAEGQQKYIRQIARAVLALRPAAPRAPLTLGPRLFQFDSFTGWVNHAQTAWKKRGVCSDYTLCIDAAGRICRIGRDFMKARDENKFPVSVYLMREDIAHGISQEGGV